MVEEEYGSGRNFMDGIDESKNKNVSIRKGIGEHRMKTEDSKIGCFSGKCFVRSQLPGAIKLSSLLTERSML
jgi:hypothetical protein